MHANAGKHSGRNALRTKLQALGFDLAQDQLDDVFKRFKVLPPRHCQHFNTASIFVACALDSSCDTGCTLIL